MRAADLDVERVGSGPLVVLVHGSIVDARRTWRAQFSLAERWSLCLPNRPGFGGSRRRPGANCQEKLFATLDTRTRRWQLPGWGPVLLSDTVGFIRDLPHHLIASFKATLEEARQANLLLHVAAASNPAADALLERGEQLYRGGSTIPPDQFLRMFREGVHSAHHTPEELPSWLERGAMLAARERPPWEAEIPFGELAAWRFPKLVVSGGHSAAFEAVCDVVAERIGAERAVVAGRGHTIPSAGEAYNARVEKFLTGAEAMSDSGSRRALS